MLVATWVKFLDKKKYGDDTDDWVRYSDRMFKRVGRKLRDAEDFLQVLKTDRDMREAQKRRGVLKWWFFFEMVVGSFLVRRSHLIRRC